jgi:hypothetical protein
LADQAEQSAVATRQLAQATNEAAAQSRRLADAAASANKISEQALVGVQRAFMRATDVAFEGYPANGQDDANWLGLVQWQNSGNTPTRDMVITVDCLTSFEGNSDPYKIYDDVEVDKTRFSGTEKAFFVPRQTATVGGCFVNPLQPMFTALGVPLYQYISGRAVYHDALGSSEIHLTEFCFVLYDIKFAAGQTRKTVTAKRNRCSAHNCADDECPQEDRKAASLVMSAQKAGEPAVITPR